MDELWKHKHVKSLKSDARRSHSIAKVLPRTFKRSIGTLASKILSSGLGWISALLDVWFGDWLFVQESTITHNRALLEKEPEGRETASDRPSIQPKVRPTDSPSSLTEAQNKYCVDCYVIYSIHSHYKGAASFVVSFVVVINRVDVVAVNTIFV